MQHSKTWSSEEIAAAVERDRLDNERARIHHNAHTLREAPHHLTPAQQLERAAEVRAYLGRHCGGETRVTAKDIAQKARVGAEQRAGLLEGHAAEMATIAREACAAEQVERPEHLSDAGRATLLEHLIECRTRHDATIATLDAAELAHHETELLASIPPLDA